VAVQTYDNWEVCLVDDCSQQPEVTEVIEAFARAHPQRVTWAQNESNGHISLTSNRCLSMASGEFVALLDHDDRLLPNALGEFVRHLNWLGPADIFYSDEQVIDEQGHPVGEPFFKPSWSHQLALRVNYTTHLSFYSKALLDGIGGFRQGFEGSQDHDLLLRALEATTAPVQHIPMVLYQWRAHEQSSAGALANKPYAVAAGVRAVKEHLDRSGFAGEVSWDKATAHYRVQYALRSGTPLVSIVICSKDKPELIGACLDSIFETSTYSNYEIILVDNGTTDATCLKLFDHLQATKGALFRRIPFPYPFNFGAMNNRGVAEARGEFVILLNNDTKVISPDWIQELVQLAQLPRTGAVGAKLLFGNGRIQHAGVALADRMVAFHMCSGMKATDDHYWNTINTVHEVAAVTGACLCIERQKYLGIGGLKEIFVPNGYGDVDFCLRLSSEAGLENLYTPHAELFHYESPTRKISFELFERNYLLAECGQQIIGDRFFNPNYERVTRYTASHYSMQFQLSAAAFQYLLSTPPETWSEETFRSKHSWFKRL
jgi:GT2 family glycosyltransferase